ncbi:MAG: DUF2173 family protein [Chromatiales bacterium]|nr:DUF2173 family protein [Chromatiales bacterium]
MIRRALALDGVTVICRFRDDGMLVEAYGLIAQEQMAGLAKFAYEYKRIVQGNADQLSMFTQVAGWTPPRGWVVHGKAVAVCSVGNLVALINADEGNVSEVMRELDDLSHY